MVFTPEPSPIGREFLHRRKMGLHGSSARGTSLLESDQCFAVPGLSPRGTLGRPLVWPCNAPTLVLLCRMRGFLTAFERLVFKKQCWMLSLGRRPSYDCVKPRFNAWNILGMMTKLMILGSLPIANCTQGSSYGLVSNNVPKLTLLAYCVHTTDAVRVKLSTDTNLRSSLQESLEKDGYFPVDVKILWCLEFLLWFFVWYGIRKSIFMVHRAFIAYLLPFRRLFVFLGWFFGYRYQNLLPDSSVVKNGRYETKETVSEDFCVSCCSFGHNSDVDCCNASKSLECLSYYGIYQNDPIVYVELVNGINEVISFESGGKLRQLIRGDAGFVTKTIAPMRRLNYCGSKFPSDLSFLKNIHVVKVTYQPVDLCKRYLEWNKYYQDTPIAYNEVELKMYAKNHSVVSVLDQSCIPDELPCSVTVRPDDVVPQSARTDFIQDNVVAIALRFIFNALYKLYLLFVQFKRSMICRGSFRTFVDLVNICRAYKNWFKLFVFRCPGVVVEISPGFSVFQVRSNVIVIRGSRRTVNYVLQYYREFDVYTKILSMYPQADPLYYDYLEDRVGYVSDSLYYDNVPTIVTLDDIRKRPSVLYRLALKCGTLPAFYRELFAFVSTNAVPLKVHTYEKLPGFGLGNDIDVSADPFITGDRDISKIDSSGIKQVKNVLPKVVTDAVLVKAGSVPSGHNSSYLPVDNVPAPTMDEKVVELFKVSSRPPCPIAYELGQSSYDSRSKSSAVLSSVPDVAIPPPNDSMLHSQVQTDESYVGISTTHINNRNSNLVREGDFSTNSTSICCSPDVLTGSKTRTSSISSDVSAPSYSAVAAGKRKRDRRKKVPALGLNESSTDLKTDLKSLSKALSFRSVSPPKFDINSKFLVPNYEPASPTEKPLGKEEDFWSYDEKYNIKVPELKTGSLPNVKSVDVPSKPSGSRMSIDVVQPQFGPLEHEYAPIAYGDTSRSTSSCSTTSSNVSKEFKINEGASCSGINDGFGIETSVSGNFPSSQQAPPLGVLQSPSPVQELTFGDFPRGLDFTCEKSIVGDFPRDVAPEQLLPVVGDFPRDPETSVSANFPRPQEPVPQEVYETLLTSIQKVQLNDLDFLDDDSQPQDKVNLQYGIDEVARGASFTFDSSLSTFANLTTVSAKYVDGPLGATKEAIDFSFPPYDRKLSSIPLNEYKRFLGILYMGVPCDYCYPIGFVWVKEKLTSLLVHKELFQAGIFFKGGVTKGDIDFIIESLILKLGNWIGDIFVDVPFNTTFADMVTSATPGPNTCGVVVLSVNTSDIQAFIKDLVGSLRILKSYGTLVIFVPNLFSEIFFYSLNILPPMFCSISVRRVPVNNALTPGAAIVCRRAYYGVHLYKDVLQLFDISRDEFLVNTKAYYTTFPSSFSSFLAKVYTCYGDFVDYLINAVGNTSKHLPTYGNYFNLSRHCSISKKSLMSRSLQRGYYYLDVVGNTLTAKYVNGGFFKRLDYSPVLPPESLFVGNLQSNRVVFTQIVVNRGIMLPQADRSVVCKFLTVLYNNSLGKPLPIAAPLPARSAIPEPEIEADGSLHDIPNFIYKRSAGDSSITVSQPFDQYFPGWHPLSVLASLTQVEFESLSTTNLGVLRQSFLTALDDIPQLYSVLQDVKVLRNVRSGFFGRRGVFVVKEISTDDVVVTPVVIGGYTSAPYWVTGLLPRSDITFTYDSAVLLPVLGSDGIPSGTDTYELRYSRFLKMLFGYCQTASKRVLVFDACYYASARYGFNWLTLAEIFEYIHFKTNCSFKIVADGDVNVKDNYCSLKDVLSVNAEVIYDACRLRFLRWGCIGVLVTVTLLGIWSAYIPYYYLCRLLMCLGFVAVFLLFIAMLKWGRVWCFVAPLGFISGADGLVLEVPELVSDLSVNVSVAVTNSTTIAMTELEIYSGVLSIIFFLITAISMLFCRNYQSRFALVPCAFLGCFFSGFPAFHYCVIWVTGVYTWALYVFLHDKFALSLFFINLSVYFLLPSACGPFNLTCFVMALHQLKEAYGIMERNILALVVYFILWSQFMYHVGYVLLVVKPGCFTGFLVTYMGCFFMHGFSYAWRGVMQGEFGSFLGYLVLVATFPSLVLPLITYRLIVGDYDWRNWRRLVGGIVRGIPRLRRFRGQAALMAGILAVAVFPQGVVGSTVYTNDPTSDFYLSEPPVLDCLNYTLDYKPQYLQDYVFDVDDANFYSGGKKYTLRKILYKGGFCLDAFARKFVGDVVVVDGFEIDSTDYDSTDCVLYSYIQRTVTYCDIPKYSQGELDKMHRSLLLGFPRKSGVPRLPDLPASAYACYSKDGVEYCCYRGHLKCEKSLAHLGLGEFNHTQIHDVIQEIAQGPKIIEAPKVETVLELLPFQPSINSAGVCDRNRIYLGDFPDFNFSPNSLISGGYLCYLDFVRDVPADLDCGYLVGFTDYNYNANLRFRLDHFFDHLNKTPSFSIYQRCSAIFLDPNVEYDGAAFVVGTLDDVVTHFFELLGSRYSVFISKEGITHYSSLGFPTDFQAVGCVSHTTLVTYVGDFETNWFTGQIQKVDFCRVPPCIDFIKSIGYPVVVSSDVTLTDTCQVPSVGQKLGYTIGARLDFWDSQHLPDDGYSLGYVTFKTFGFYNQVLVSPTYLYFGPTPPHAAVNRKWGSCVDYFYPCEVLQSSEVTRGHMVPAQFGGPATYSNCFLQLKGANAADTVCEGNFPYSVYEKSVRSYSSDTLVISKPDILCYVGAYGVLPDSPTGAIDYILSSDLNVFVARDDHPYWTDDSFAFLRDAAFQYCGVYSYDISVNGTICRSYDVLEDHQGKAALKRPFNNVGQFFHDDICTPWSIGFDGDPHVLSAVREGCYVSDLSTAGLYFKYYYATTFLYTKYHQPTPDFRLTDHPRGLLPIGTVDRRISVPADIYAPCEIAGYVAWAVDQALTYEVCFGLSACRYDKHISIQVFTGVRSTAPICDYGVIPSDFYRSFTERCIPDLSLTKVEIFILMYLDSIGYSHPYRSSLSAMNYTLDYANVPTALEFSTLTGRLLNCSDTTISPEYVPAFMPILTGQPYTVPSHLAESFIAYAQSVGNENSFSFPKGACVTDANAYAIKVLFKGKHIGSCSRWVDVLPSGASLIYDRFGLETDTVDVCGYSIYDDVDVFADIVCDFTNIQGDLVQEPVVYLPRDGKVCVLDGIFVDEIAFLQSLATCRTLSIVGLGYGSVLSSMKVLSTLDPNRYHYSFVESCHVDPNDYAEYQHLLKRWDVQVNGVSYALPSNFVDTKTLQTYLGSCPFHFEYTRKYRDPDTYVAPFDACSRLTDSEYFVISESFCNSNLRAFYTSSAECGMHFVNSARVLGLRVWFVDRIFSFAAYPLVCNAVSTDSYIVVDRFGYEEIYVDQVEDIANLAFVVRVYPSAESDQYVEYNYDYFNYLGGFYTKDRSFCVQHSKGRRIPYVGKPGYCYHDYFGVPFLAAVTGYAGYYFDVPYFEYVNAHLHHVILVLAVLLVTLYLKCGLEVMTVFVFMLRFLHASLAFLAASETSPYLISFLSRLVLDLFGGTVAFSELRFLFQFLNLFFMSVHLSLFFRKLPYQRAGRDYIMVMFLSLLMVFEMRSGIFLASIVFVSVLYFITSFITSFWLPLHLRDYSNVKVTSEFLNKVLHNYGIGSLEECKCCASKLLADYNPTVYVPKDNNTPISVAKDLFVKGNFLRALAESYEGSIPLNFNPGKLMYNISVDDVVVDYFKFFGRYLPKFTYTRRNENFTGNVRVVFSKSLQGLDRVLYRITGDQGYVHGWVKSGYLYFPRHCLLNCNIPHNTTVVVTSQDGEFQMVLDVPIQAFTGLPVMKVDVSTCGLNEIPFDFKQIDGNMKCYMPLGGNISVGNCTVYESIGSHNISTKNGDCGTPIICCFNGVYYISGVHISASIYPPIVNFFVPYDGVDFVIKPDDFDYTKTYRPAIDVYPVDPVRAVCTILHYISANGISEGLAETCSRSNIVGCESQGELSRVLRSLLTATDYDPQSVNLIEFAVFGCVNSVDLRSELYADIFAGKENTVPELTTSFPALVRDNWVMLQGNYTRFVCAIMAFLTLYVFKVVVVFLLVVASWQLFGYVYLGRMYFTFTFGIGRILLAGYLFYGVPDAFVFVYYIVLGVLTSLGLADFVILPSFTYETPVLYIFSVFVLLGRYVVARRIIRLDSLYGLFYVVVLLTVDYVVFCYVFGVRLRVYVLAFFMIPYCLLVVYFYKFARKVFVSKRNQVLVKTLRNLEMYTFRSYPLVILGLLVGVHFWLIFPVVMLVPFILCFFWFVDSVKVESDDADVQDVIVDDTVRGFRVYVDVLTKLLSNIVSQANSTCFSVFMGPLSDFVDNSSSWSVDQYVAYCKNLKNLLEYIVGSDVNSVTDEAIQNLVARLVERNDFRLYRLIVGVMLDRPFDDVLVLDLMQFYHRLYTRLKLCSLFTDEAVVTCESEVDDTPEMIEYKAKLEELNCITAKLDFANAKLVECCDAVKDLGKVERKPYNKQINLLQAEISELRKSYNVLRHSADVLYNSIETQQKQERHARTQQIQRLAKLRRSRDSITLLFTSFITQVGKLLSEDDPLVSYSKNIANLMPDEIKQVVTACKRVYHLCCDKFLVDTPSGIMSYLTFDPATKRYVVTNATGISNLSQGSYIDSVFCGGVIYNYEQLQDDSQLTRDRITGSSTLVIGQPRDRIPEGSASDVSNFGLMLKCGVPLFCKRGCRVHNVVECPVHLWANLATHMNSCKTCLGDIRDGTYPCGSKLRYPYKIISYIEHYLTCDHIDCSRQRVLEGLSVHLDKIKHELSYTTTRPVYVPVLKDNIVYYKGAPIASLVSNPSVVRSYRYGDRDYYLYHNVLTADVLYAIRTIHNDNIVTTEASDFDSFAQCFTVVKTPRYDPSLIDRPFVFCNKAVGGKNTTTYTYTKCPFDCPNHDCEFCRVLCDASGGAFVVIQLQGVTEPLRVLYDAFSLVGFQKAPVDHIRYYT
nr:ORF1a protein [Macrobrachium rosenbergii Golda virus]